ncbi:protein-tyrosine phosphatase-like protein, partial [Paraphysoderma sedebokerense]
HTPHASISSSQRLLNPPSLIEYKNMKFLVMDAPSDGNLPLYMKEMDKHGVTDVVRACDPTYSKEPLEKRGIKVHELNFKDGDPPPNHVINEWLSLVYNKFKANQSTVSTSHNSGVSAIAVHCVAGLGRAPILVAIALIEFTSMPPLETIEFIRKKRRGAFNSRQIQFIDSYKKRG